MTAERNTIWNDRIEAQIIRVLKAYHEADAKRTRGTVADKISEILRDNPNLTEEQIALMVRKKASYVAEVIASRSEWQGKLRTGGSGSR